MKRGLLFLFVIAMGIAFGNERAKEIYPMVDQRVELLSIVARLAEYPEFATSNNKAYVKDIDTHFDVYRDHPLIKYVRDIREKPGIEFGAMMQMAVSLSQPPALKPAVSLKSLEPFCWDKKTSSQFLILLWNFYTEARCEEFFEEQYDRYDEANKKLIPLFTPFDTDWYQNFYGLKYPVSFRIFPGLGNSMQSYNLKQSRPGGLDRIYLVAAIREFDEQGDYVLPKGETFSSDLKNMIYLYNYPCIRPLVAKHEILLKEVGESFSNDSLKTAFKGSWEDFWVESISRAVAIHYMRAHEKENARVHAEYLKKIAGEFAWMPELVVFLDSYQNDRTSYPTFESFLPRVNDFMKGWLQKNSAPMLDKMEDQAASR